MFHYSVFHYSIFRASVFRYSVFREPSFPPSQHTHLPWQKKWTLTDMAGSKERWEIHLPLILKFIYIFKKLPKRLLKKYVCKANLQLNHDSGQNWTFFEDLQAGGNRENGRRKGVLLFFFGFPPRLKHQSRSLSPSSSFPSRFSTLVPVGRLSTIPPFLRNEKKNVGPSVGPPFFFGKPSVGVSSFLKKYRNVEEEEWMTRRGEKDLFAHHFNNKEKENKPKKVFLSGKWIVRRLIFPSCCPGFKQVFVQSPAADNRHLIWASEGFSWDMCALSFCVVEGTKPLVRPLPPFST